jgi:hypothetical protein
VEGGRCVTQPQEERVRKRKVEEEKRKKSAGAAMKRVRTCWELAGLPFGEVIACWYIMD